MGEQLAHADGGNPEGHFEDIEFLKMHEEILGNHNLPRTGITDAQLGDLTIYEKEKVKSIIKVKQQLYDQWGWKDPRTCLFLDLYKELLPDARYLVIMRDYQSVVSSLLRREFKHVDKKYMSRKFISRLVWLKFRKHRRQQAFYHRYAQEFLTVWIAYNQDILNYIKKLNRDSFLVANYTMLIKEDAKVFSYLKDKWDFSMKYFMFKDVFKEGLIGEDLNIEPYIADNSLITKARQLQSELEAYTL